MTRELWLETATESLRTGLFSPLGYVVPPVKVSVGFPSKNALSARRRTVGQCWRGSASADGVPQILISPLVADPAEVLAILAHELIHAIYPNAGHRRGFQTPADRIGLLPPWTATTAGDELKRRLNDLAAILGPFPHVALQASQLARPQRGRLRLYECQCPVKVRVASDDFQATCDVCGEPFEPKGR